MHWRILRLPKPTEEFVDDLFTSLRNSHGETVPTVRIPVWNIKTGRPTSIVIWISSLMAGTHDAKHNGVISELKYWTFGGYNGAHYYSGEVWLERGIVNPEPKELAEKLVGVAHVGWVVREE